MIGGGLIGTAIGWRLRQAGIDVEMVVGERAAAASHVAAGMLAPITETTFTEQKLLQLNPRLTLADSPTSLPSWSLQQSAGRTSPAPNLSVAYDADDAARLATLPIFWHEPVTRANICPAESAGVTSHCWHRRSAPAYWSKAMELRQPTAVAGSHRNGHRTGVRDLPGFVHRHLLDWSGNRRSASRRTNHRCRHRRGGERRLGTPDRWTSRSSRTPSPKRPDPPAGPGPAARSDLTIRAYSRGSEIYLVPRESGREVVLGATVEELGFDRRVTAGAVYELLPDGRTVMPMTAEYALAETSVGWRPGTPDNAPILGRCDLDGLVLATGRAIAMACC